jgi:hypothetical protein
MLTLLVQGNQHAKKDTLHCTPGVSWCLIWYVGITSLNTSSKDTIISLRTVILSSGASSFIISNSRLKFLVCKTEKNHFCIKLSTFGMEETKDSTLRYMWQHSECKLMNKVLTMSTGRVLLITFKSCSATQQNLPHLQVKVHYCPHKSP